MSSPSYWARLKARRPATLEDGPVNVRWFGARGDGRSDDTAGIQRAIDAVAEAGDGRALYFPHGIYQVSSPLIIGGAGNRIEGVSLRGAGSSFAAIHTAIHWIGADDGGPIVQVRNASAGHIEGIAFNGRGLARECVQFTHVLGDAGLASNWRVVGCFFKNAKEHNVLIGERSGTTYGDCCCITFDNCYFSPSQAGVTTQSHLRQRAQYTFGTTLVNCRIGSDQTFYPTYGISLQGGTATMIGGLLEIQGGASFHLDGVNGTPFPALCAYSVEVQSGNELLRSNAAGGGSAAQRATVLSGVFHSDIKSPTSALSIYWDVPWFGALVLDGCRFQGDVEIANANAKVFSHGTVFDSGKGFIGTGAHRVHGEWVDGNSIGGTYHQRAVGLPTYADSAAAVAGGLVAGDLYQTQAGVLMVTV